MVFLRSYLTKKTEDVIMGQMRVKISKLVILLVVISSILLSIFALPVLAASSNFFPKATRFYEFYCTKKSLPDIFAVSCYLFDKVKDLENKISSLQTRSDALESENTSQWVKISELEDRITSLENMHIPTPTPEPTPEPEILFRDNFDSGNTNNWEILGGTWQVIDGQLVGSGDAIPLPIALVKDLVLSDYIIELDMTSITRVDKLVFVRFKDVNNFIVLNFRAARPLTPTDVVLEESVNGIVTRFTPEFSVPIPTHQLGEPIHVSIEGKGNSMKISVNDTQVLNNSYSFINLEGRFGLGVFNSNANSFDNVVISTNP